MIEWVSLAATILGYTVKDLSNIIDEEIKRRKKGNIERLRQDEASYASQKAVSDVLINYYKSKDAPNGNLKRYSFLIDETIIKTTIYTSDDYLSINKTPKEISSFLIPPKSLNIQEMAKPAAIREYAPKAIARLQSMGIQIWNAPLYRLIETSKQENLSLFFNITNFITYRFTAGLLADELIESLVRTKGARDEILSNPSRFMPIREEIMPNLSFLENLSTRICAGGIGVIFAIARGEPHNDYYIPLQVRSSTVSDGRNQFSTLPKAFHQPLVGNEEEELNLQWTVFRELYEEVFGGEEVERDSNNINHDWYFEKENGVAYFRDHVGAYELDVVCLGFNAVAGNYDFGILLTVRDSWYWNIYAQQMKKIWESNKIVWISTKDEKKIKDVLVNAEWANESIPNFVECLHRLEQIDPKRVKLPKIYRILEN